MMKKLLSVAALALAFGAQTAAAQRVGPVEEEPAAAPARVEKKSEAAKPEPGKVGAETKPAPTPAVKTAAADPAGKSAAAATPGNKPADGQTAAPLNGDAAHAARGERAAGNAGDAPIVAATAQQAGQKTLPVFGSPSIGTLPPAPKYVPPPPVKAEISPAPAAAANPAPPGAVAPPPTSIYRLGAGDILDIRLKGGLSREATLYTVLPNGTIDYPPAGQPTQVAGLTPEEIGARLSAALKQRGIFDRAEFQVGVREYASHTVLVSGLVDQAGQKVLRREAVPLYVVLAEAFPRPDAGRVVVISRSTGLTKTLDLSDSNALNELVSNGDVINVQPRPREFFYIGGQINAAGQKDFNPGMTLTQAILASGGLTREAGAKVRVAVARQGADGRLVTVEYNLQEIESGQIPDPRVQAGDRIEVGRRR